MPGLASTTFALVAALQVAISGGTRVWGLDRALEAASASASDLTACTPKGSSYTYGEPASDPSSQYNGRVFDPGTGFHDYGARMYWPEIGRFISADSYLGDPGNPASLNRYAYVGNNPYKYTDPTGHYVESLLDVAFIAYDIGSYGYHIATGNRDAALVDVAALGADVTCLLVPVATGGGLLVRSGNEGVHLLWSGSKEPAQAELKLEQGGVRSFDEARREAFQKSGMTDPAKVEFSKVDPATGTVVEFKGPGGAKVGYDGPHSSPGPSHDTQHISWQSGGKRSAGAQRGNIPYEGAQHPSRSKTKD